MDVPPSPKSHAHETTDPSPSALASVKTHASAEQLDVNEAVGAWLAAGTVTS